MAESQERSNEEILVLKEIARRGLETIESHVS
jgi:hypothetical protein